VADKVFVHVVNRREDLCEERPGVRFF
jgi:hypothetical protein